MQKLSKTIQNKSKQSKNMQTIQVANTGPVGAHLQTGEKKAKKAKKSIHEVTTPMAARCSYTQKRSELESITGRS